MEIEDMVERYRIGLLEARRKNPGLYDTGTKRLLDKYEASPKGRKKKRRKNI